MLINKLAVVTGGASGIGYAIANIFLKNNAEVAVFDSNQTSLDRVKETLGDSVLCIQGDVTNLADLEDFFRLVKQKYNKKIDIVVASAGIAEFDSIDKVTETSFDRVVNTNFKGVYFTVQKSLSYLNSTASIILISSIAAHGGFANNSLYSATKAAVSMLAKNLSADLIDQGIRVNAISPGNTLTPMLDEVKKGKSPEFLSRLQKLTPLNRFANPEEIGKLALFLASDDSNYIVGEDIVIDGGMTKIFPKMK